MIRDAGIFVATAILGFLIPRHEISCFTLTAHALIGGNMVYEIELTQGTDFAEASLHGIDDYCITPLPSLNGRAAMLVEFRRDLVQSGITLSLKGQEALLPMPVHSEMLYPLSEARVPMGAILMGVFPSESGSIRTVILPKQPSQLPTITLKSEAFNTSHFQLLLHRDHLTIKVLPGSPKGYFRGDVVVRYSPSLNNTIPISGVIR